MNPIYQTISDDKFDFIEVELRNELRKLLMKAGRKKIVLRRFEQNQRMVD